MPVYLHLTSLCKTVAFGLRTQKVKKVKVKFTLEQSTKAYSSPLSLTSALYVGGRVVNATPRPPYPRERPGTHCIGCWVLLYFMSNHSVMIIKHSQTYSLFATVV